MAYNFTTGDGERIFSPMYADVWDTTLKHMSGAATKVYIALLMHTTQRDRTWFMSIEELAEDAGVSRSTASVAKDRLIEEGLVTQTWRYRDEAGDYHLTDTRPPPRLQGKNVYKVNVKPQDVESENRAHDSGNRVRKSDPIESENRTLVESENRNPTRAPSPEPPTRTPSNDESDDSPLPKPKRNVYSSEFNDWWFRYPKRSGSKKNAFAQFKLAVKRISLEELTAATDRLRDFVDAGHQDPRFLKDAERWLKEDRWEEELIPRSQPQQQSPFSQQSPRRKPTWNDLAQQPPPGPDYSSGHQVIDNNPPF